MKKLLVKVVLFIALNATLWFAYEWEMPEPSCSLEYKRQIAKALGRRVAPLPKGRPSKAKAQ